jgi:predicted nucleotidyltransferase
VWDGDTIIPEVKSKLLEVAEAFLESIEIPIDIEDITLTGSLANFNYTEYSDFDLHIITDCREYNIDEKLLKDYFKAKKTVWNSTHEIKIKGYDVEVYMQDILEPHHSTGVYSLKNDEWVLKPKKAGPIDKKEVQSKAEAMRHMIDHALSDKCNLECAENVRDKILKTRQAGLMKGGEFSVENLAYKELRRTKDIDRLIQGVIAKRDKELSLNQEAETFKTFMSQPGMTSGKGSRGPRHQSPTAGMSKLTKHDTKSVSIIAKTHREMETPFPEIENLKKKPRGKVYIIPQTANAIARFYNINMEKVATDPRGLSTSGITLGFDPVVNRYYLSK